MWAARSEVMFWGILVGALVGDGCGSPTYVRPAGKGAATAFDAGSFEVEMVIVGSPPDTGGVDASGGRTELGLGLGLGAGGQTNAGGEAGAGGTGAGAGAATGGAPAGQDAKGGSGAGAIIDPIASTGGAPGSGGASATGGARRPPDGHAGQGGGLGGMGIAPSTGGMGTDAGSAGRPGSGGVPGTGGSAPGSPDAGAGGGGAAGGGTGMGGGAAQTDTARYSFEPSAPTWFGTPGTPPFTFVGRSMDAHFSGAYALAGTLTADAPRIYELSTPGPRIPPGATVTFHVFVPQGALISWVEPFVLQGAPSDVRTEQRYPVGMLSVGAWSTLILRIPTNADPIRAVGVEFNVTAPWAGTVYIDSVDW